MSKQASQSVGKLTLKQAVEEIILFQRQVTGAGSNGTITERKGKLFWTPSPRAARIIKRLSKLSGKSEAFEGNRFLNNCARVGLAALKTCRA